MGVNFLILLLGFSNNHYHYLLSLLYVHRLSSFKIVKSGEVELREVVNNLSKATVSKWQHLDFKASLLSNKSVVFKKHITLCYYWTLSWQTTLEYTFSRRYSRSEERLEAMRNREDQPTGHHVYCLWFPWRSGWS